MSFHLGLQYEQIAQHFLESKGYSLVDHNFHSEFGEIDLIMQDKTDLVFIEVKGKQNNQLTHPIENITRSKLSKIKKTIEYYLLTHETKRPIRFEAVSIEGSLENPQITHYTHIYF